MCAKNETNVLGVGVFIGIIVVILVIAYGVIMRLSSCTMTQQGQFGDQFGALNTLFSGLAFAALVGTIILQNRELKTQRDELRLTREEFSKSANAQKDMVEAQLKSARIYAWATIIQANEPVIVASHDPRVTTYKQDEIMKAKYAIEEAYNAIQQELI